jgi:PIN domain nuclease of toxin-antitoxin system
MNTQIYNVQEARTHQHVWELGNLPQLHRDPFDRLLIAQARYESDEDVLGTESQRRVLHAE